MQQRFPKKLLVNVCKEVFRGTSITAACGSGGGDAEVSDGHSSDCTI